MVQVHTVYESSGWHLTVDGLRQPCPSSTHAGVVELGRRTAAELGGRYYVHDVDGRVVTAIDFGRASGRGRVDAELYLG